MITALLGLLTGIFLCLTFGTVFFALIQTSVEKGYKYGINIAMGVVATDAFFVFCSIFGTSFLPQINGFDDWLTGIGIVFLVVLGILNLVKKVKVQNNVIDIKTKISGWKYFLKGAFLNALNPINFVSWVTIATYLRTNTKFNYELKDMVIFFSMSLVGVAITEVSLAVYADKLSKSLTPKTISSINKVTGVVFISIAAKLCWIQFLVPEISYAPKPKGYSRIDLPAHQYQTLENTHPYSFQYSSFAKILPDTFARAEPHWIFVAYPVLNASIQLTYKDVNNNPKLLAGYIDDAYKLASKHQVKASGIQEQTFMTKKGRKVVMFKLTGDVPSYYQFFTTDSTKHFLRGAMYFNVADKPDSLAPVIDYLKIDLDKLIETLEWKQK